MFKHLSGLSHHAAWRKQLELLLDSAGEGIYGIDLNGRCIFINRAGAEMLGYSPDEVLGRNMHYLMHHSYSNRDLMPVCECNIFKAFQQNKGCRVDNEVLWRRDGSSFPAEYASYPILENGDILGAVVTFNDISERVEVQRIRAAAQVELERRVEERTAQLSRAHTRMRKLSAHLNTVREEERTRIAREIHDELGSKLTALNLHLNTLNHRHQSDTALATQLEDMLGLTQDAMNNLREILNDLRPGLLDHLGLWAALDHLLTEHRQRQPLHTVLQLSARIESLRLSRQTETALYRIAQEALTNAQKHAQARQFTITAEDVGCDLVMTLSDDGQGIDLGHQPNQGFGLMGIEERAWDIGARCKLGQSSEGGFQIQLRLPGVLV